LTPQHHIIKETSDTLARFFQNEFKRAGYKRVHIVGEAPKPDAIEGKLPAVCIYLYSVAPDWENVQHARGVGESVKRYRTPQGRIVEVLQSPPAWVKLEYLISCWAQTPEDEQLLLGLAIKALAATPCLMGDDLKGDSFPVDYDLPIQLSDSLDESTASRFWGSLNQPIRPALQMWTLVPIISDVEREFRRVEERIITHEDLDNGQKEVGPEGNIDVPPDGTFVKRLK